MRFDSFLGVSLGSYSCCCVFVSSVSFFVCFAFACCVPHGNENQVKRLDGLVRTLALYGILERNVMDSSK